MRRYFALLLATAAFGCLPSGLFAQYPYPVQPMYYGPMPVQYMPPYGYPPPHMARPMYYQAPMMRPPAPMYYYQPTYGGPQVYNYGALTETTELPIGRAPAPMKAAAVPAKPAPTKVAAVPSKSALTKAANVPSKTATVQASETKESPTVPAKTAMIQVSGTKELPAGNPTGPIPASGSKEASGVKQTPTKTASESKAAPGVNSVEVLPEVYVPAGDGPVACGPECDPVARPRPHAYGHFVGEIGVYFLIPYSGSRAAFSNTDFSRETYLGPRASLSYVFHSGWGFRGNYWHLNGDTNESVANGSRTTTVNAALSAPFLITSPSLTLNQGIGIDRFSATQRLDMNVADIELVKEASWMDTAFLFSCGGRYARILQAYSATRTNEGGSVALDRQELESFSRFQGWGPTLALESVHPLTRWGLCTYGTLRGSWLFGVDRFSQSLNTQRRSTTLPFIDTTLAQDNFDKRMVSTVDLEGGLQWGCRLGGCYVFTRAGAAYQRWWEVGAPTSADGDLTLLGGTLMLGITY